MVFVSYSGTDLRRKFKGSQFLQLTNTVEIESGATFIFPIDERFTPYDSCTITNLNTENDVEATINYSQIFPIPKGTSSTEYPSVTTLKIKNNGSTTIAVNEIVVNIQNTGHQGRKIIKNVEKGISALGSVSLIRGFFK